MPAAKRARTMSSSSSLVPRKKGGRKRSLFKTNQVQRNWPYASIGTGPLFDPFPAQMRARLRYSTTVTMTTLAATATPYLFRANSIFDPDYSGVGHQPYGHDTFASIYNHYEVESSVITVRPTSTSQGIYGVTLTDDTSVNASYDTVREIKTTKFAVMTTSNTSDSSIVNYYNRKQVFAIDQGGVQAVFGNNPGMEQFFHLWVEPNNSVSGGSTDYRFVVDIVYNVKMWELKDLGGS